MREWRVRHPISDAWNSHRFHARKRGIAVLWDKEEFSEWCTLTGYHFLRFDGYEIHRIKREQPYFSENCTCIPKTLHVAISSAEHSAWHLKQKQHHG
jgi:hypothetical protein